jgi:hypothetical protein
MSLIDVCHDKIKGNKQSLRLMDKIRHNINLLDLIKNNF